MDGGDAGILSGVNGFQKEYYNDVANINNVHVSGTIEADCRVGGLVGTKYGYISNSSANIELKVNDFTGGGFVGANDGSINSSYSAGLVTGSPMLLGGFVGSNGVTPNRISEIYDCYSSGEVRAIGFHSQGQVGGFAGRNDHEIQNSYASCTVIYDTNASATEGHNLSVGGFAGYANTGSVTTNGYWDVDKSRLHNGVGDGIVDGLGNFMASNTTAWTLTGLTTAQMNTSSSFEGWDFDNTWTIIDGIDYPKLQFFVGKLNSSTPTPPSDDYFPSPGDSDCSCDCGSSSASTELSSRKESMDEEFGSSDGGFLSSNDLWLSQNVSVHNDQMSYLHDDTVIDLLGTTETVEQAVAGIQAAFGDDAEVMTAVQEAVKAADEGDTESVLRILTSVADDGKREAAVRLVLSRYFTGKAAEQMLLARKDLGKASQGGGASMNSVMEALVGARMYAIAAEATAGGNAGSKQELAELPPTVDSLY